MKIWAVCKDPGGTAGLLPVVDELIRRGHEVRLIANGKAVETLTKAEQPFISWEGGQAEDMIKQYPCPNLFLTTMCSKGGVGRDLVPLMREKGVPVVALQDFWVGAAGQADSWLDSKYRPDFITTNDEVGKDLLAKVWPDFDRERIVITGFPAFDKYAGMDFEAKREQARKKLGLVDKFPVISFAGGGALTHIAHDLLLEALKRLGDRVYYLPRPHPRTLNDFPEEAEPWQQAVAEVAEHHVVVYDYFGQCDMTDVVAVSDVVCSISSTSLLDAAVMRRAAISIMPPGPIKDRFRGQMGGVTDQYPLVPLGCCFEATALNHLLEELICGLSDDPIHSLRPEQEKHIKLGGRNAARVADLVESVGRQTLAHAL